MWYYHTDVTGTVQEVTKADGTLVWAGYHGGFGEKRGDVSSSVDYVQQPGKDHQKYVFCTNKTAFFA